MFLEGCIDRYTLKDNVAYFLELYIQSTSNAFGFVLLKIFLKLQIIRFTHVLA